MNFRPLLIVPPIAIAAALLVWMNAPKEQTAPPPEPQGLAVRVQEVTPRALKATAVGYGRAQPVHNWVAVAEVQGRIEWMKPDLAVGSVVDAGELLIRIDITDYELAKRKALSNIASVEAQIRELERQEENTRKTLEVEQRIFEVTTAEYERVISLVERGTSTQAALDNASKALLAQEASITNHRNTLALYPAKRQSFEATLAIRQAELAEAERSISKASITAPFRGRVSSEGVEEGQFVRGGDTLLSLDDISAIEIIAEVQPRSFASMVAMTFGDREGMDTVVDTTRAIETLNESGLTAEVRTAVTGLTASWPAEIVRFRGTMDNDTGSLGLVVRVEDPMVAQRPISRPPLNVGTFVEVTFSTPLIDDVLTVPRNALRFEEDGTPFVYLADAEKRLARKSIEIGAIMGNDVQVLDGLQAGETLVLSDPRPPVMGMALSPVKEQGKQ